MRVCAIHQPNFFPWMGYFDKARRADVFVFLDRVDYPKSGSSMSSWCNRVKLNIAGQARWVSCPVVREHGRQAIDAVKLNESRPWRAELKELIARNYSGARNFSRASDLIFSLLDFATDKLAEFNVNAILSIAKKLDLATEFVRQTTLPHSSATATERLIEITRAVGADAYLCGGGAAEYQDDAAFARAGVRLIYQNFTETPYGDPSEFIGGLSIIDWLMCAEEAA